MYLKKVGLAGLKYGTLLEKVFYVVSALALALIVTDNRLRGLRILVTTLFYNGFCFEESSSVDTDHFNSADLIS